MFKKFLLIIGLSAFVGLRAAVSELVNSSDVNMDEVSNPSPGPEGYTIHNSHQPTFVDTVEVRELQGQQQGGEAPAQIASASPIAQENWCCQCLAYLCWPETCVSVAGVGMCLCPCMCCEGCCEEFCCSKSKFPCAERCAERLNNPCLSAINRGLCCAEGVCNMHLCDVIPCLCCVKELCCCSVVKKGYAALREPFIDEIARRGVPQQAPAMQ